MREDYYDILGVSKNASLKEIKSAHRKLAMKYHPDRQTGEPNKEIEAKFKTISEAYAILSDSEKKQKYDQFGHDGLNGQDFSGAQDFNSMFGDVFSEMFSGGGRGGGRRQQPTRNSDMAIAGNDLQYELELELPQAVLGTKHNISFKTNSKCGNCSGTGSNSNKPPVACRTCHGQGSVRQTQGLFAVEQACPTCHGAGCTVADPCIKCHGQGRSVQLKKLTITIPAGIRNGDRMRLAGEGESGVMGGESGNLFVQVGVKPHRLFSIEGDNLILEVLINSITAMVGGEVEVPTFDGNAVILKIPSYTPNGKLLRIKGKGIANTRTKRQGDLICKVKIETPVKLSKEQLSVLYDISEQLDVVENTPNIDAWNDRVEEFMEQIKS